MKLHEFAEAFNTRQIFICYTLDGYANIISIFLTEITYFVKDGLPSAAKRIWHRNMKLAPFHCVSNSASQFKFCQFAPLRERVM